MEVWSKYYDSSASGNQDPSSLPCSQKSLGANLIGHARILHLPAPPWWASITFHVNDPLLVLQSQDQHNECLAHGVTLKDTMQEHSLTSVIYLPKMHNLVLVGSNNRQRFLICNLQKCQGHESQQRLKNYSRLKDTWQQNATCWFWTGSFCSKGHYWDKWKNLNGAWELEVINVSMIIPWFWW